MKQDKNSKKIKKKRTKMKAFLMLILLIGVITIGIFAYQVAKNGGGMQGIIATTIGHDTSKLKEVPRIEILVLGESENLTDTIMVASYDPKTQQASLLSIPRDTFIGKNKNKATAWDKINAVYQKKNSDKILEKVNALLDMKIKYYVTVDTKALIELVDAIGGVEFDVPINMKYDDVTQNLHINLKAGQQKLNGQQAEWLVRFRHNNDGSSYPEEYGDNDIGRMRTQREFITQVLKQTLRPQNILKLGQILEIANENVRTNIDMNVAKDYLPYAVNFNAEDLKTGTLPGTPEKCNGVWLYIQDKKETEDLTKELFDLQDKEENNSVATEEKDSKTEIRVELLNGSGDSKKMTKVMKLLEEEGYQIVKSGNVSTINKTTIVNKNKKAKEEVNKIKELLKVGTTSEKTDNSKVDFTITIGKDYK